MAEGDCWYKHPEDYCDLKKGDCPHQGDHMECVATEKDLVEYCSECDCPFDDLGECKCWEVLDEEILKE